ncbi:prohibitin family protein [Acidithiobacillus ferrivorans]|nr:prohibitin family protein [Acidithiobacillus ferrivorans]
MLYKIKPGKTNFTMIATAIVTIVLLVLVFMSTTTIGPGQRGVLMNFGAVQQGVLNPGLHFLIPVMQHVAKIDVRVQKYSVPETAASMDLQDVETTAAVNWHILPQDSEWVYQHLGRENAVEQNILAPAVANAVKAVTAKYNAEDLIIHRDEVRAGIETMVKENLLPYHIVVDSVNITNFSFSSQFSAAIERKQVAQQHAQQATYELQRAIVQAKQKVVTATAEARAMKLKEVSVTPELIQWEAVQKWNGKLPTIMGGGHMPFIISLPHGTVPIGAAGIGPKK